MKLKLSRFFVLVLCLILSLSCFAFVGCNNESSTSNDSASLNAAATGDNWQKYLNKDINSTADKANIQGYNGWYYVCGKPGSLERMVFNNDSGRWCSRYQQLYYYTYIWDVWFPDGQTGQGIGMTFKAPASGKMTITVKLKLLCDTTNLTSNGVTFRTTSVTGGTEYSNLCYSFTQSNKAQYNQLITIQDTNVKLGKDEEIVFLLYAVSGNNTTYTSVDINVKYTGAYL